MSGRDPKARAVILIGFMGAGKSTVGRALAGLLGWPFEDLDQRIELREARRVHEIFRVSGESGFRQAEHAALRELLKELRTAAGRIVALGGGAFVQKHNAEIIEASGVPAIFLDAGVDELWLRCRRQANDDGVERPLLGSFTSFRELYDARRPHYLKASYRQETSGKTVDKIAVELAELLGLQPSRQDQSRRKRGEKN
ncbi:MAG: shikimate kinase [Candidatus Sulfotelmatobacter sp.]